MPLPLSAVQTLSASGGLADTFWGDGGEDRQSPGSQQRRDDAARNQCMAHLVLHHQCVLVRLFLCPGLLFRQTQYDTSDRCRPNNNLRKMTPQLRIRRCPCSCMLRGGDNAVRDYVRPHSWKSRVFRVVAAKPFRARGVSLLGFTHRKGRNTCYSKRRVRRDSAYSNPSLCCRGDGNSGYFRRVWSTPRL